MPDAARWPSTTRPGTPPSGAARATCGRRTSTCPRRTPATPSGMSAFGRWMYGPWFWPPAKDAKYPPIANPYYDPTCDPNVQPLLRAGADPVDPERLGRHGGLQRHPDRQRHGLPDHDGRPEGLPLPHPQRGQRPVLEPVRGTSPIPPPAPQRGRAQAHRGGGGPDRPGRLPDAGHHQEPGRARTGSRSAPRAASCRPRWSSPPTRPPGSPIPTRFDVGNVDQHSLLLAPAERADVVVDFSPVPGQDADPLQRRARRVPGARPRLRLLHRWPGPVARPAHRPPCPATAPTPAPSCRSRSPTPRRWPSTAEHHRRPDGHS